MQQRAIYILLFILLATGFIKTVKAQTPVLGFTQQENVKKTGILTDDQLYPMSVTDKSVSRQYYDGLGRPIQTVAIGASPAQNDLIQPAAYNNLGMQTINYLPYAGKSTDVSGSYRVNALTGDLTTFYNGTADNIANDNSPWSQQVFDGSPLQRLIYSGMVGDNHQPGVTGTQHYKSIVQRPNSSAADGNIIAWNPDNGYTAVTYYADGQLAVGDFKDEDNIESLTYTDIAGHTILKRQYTSTAGVYIDTYYVYNNAGLISYVIPPKALALMVQNGNFSPAQAVINKLVFQFIYDVRGRIIQKTMPGTGTVNMIYDPLNRLVLTQDAKMAAGYKWYYIKYDAKGHAISQGTYVDASHLNAAAMQIAVTNNTTYNTYWYEKRLNSPGTGYYSNNTFPSAAITPLAYSYFDDYNLDMTGGDDYSKTDQGLTGETVQTTGTLKGMPTMVRKAIVGNGIAAGIWLITIYFYDSNGRVIQTKSNNQLTTAISDVKTNGLDFTGAPLQTKVVKVAGSTTTTVLSTVTYDHMHRVTAIDQTYNTGSPIRIAAYTYNELGQLINKDLGQLASGTIPANVTLSGNYPGTQTIVATNSITFSSSPATTIPSGATFKAIISKGYLQSVDYRYNIRGQLLSINNSKLSNDGGTTNNDSNDLFGMQFLYDQVDANLGVNDTARYNGRLAAVKWMSTDANGTSSYERSYTYGYDAVARLTSANYAERTTAGTGTFSNNIGGFDESGIKYDVNGNILALNRNSSTQGTNTNVQVDNLAYTYDPTNPNQLLKVSDGAGANYTGYGFRNLTGATSTAFYTYDVNGNLASDPYKGIALGYNDLNRTDNIAVGSTGAINYTYDASGVLLRKQVYSVSGGTQTLQTTTDYSDGFVYTTAGAGTATLSYFAMPEGRVRNTGTALKPEYIISDQQGNARISFEESTTSPGNAVVRQENSYYAFGLVMPNSPVSTPTTDNKQLYNGGSEWQNDFSNLPDYYQTFYRNYDAALGRFVGVDPMAEGTESMTTYHYAGNNPIMYNDPLGNMLANHGFTPSPTNADGTTNWMGVPWAVDDIYSNMNYSGTAGGGGSGIGGYISGNTGGETIYTKAAVTNPGQGTAYSIGFDRKVESAVPNGLDHDTYWKKAILNDAIFDDGLGRKTERIETGYVEVPQGMDINANQGGGSQQASSDNGSSWLHLIGPGLVTLGADIIPKSFASNFIRSFVVQGASKYTSIASVAFRKLIPSTWETLEFLPRSISLGGQLGRAVPYVGWAITAYDVTYNGSKWLSGVIINALPYSDQAKQPELMPDGTVWHPEH